MMEPQTERVERIHTSSSSSSSSSPKKIFSNDDSPDHAADNQQTSRQLDQLNDGGSTLHINNGCEGDLSNKNNVSEQPTNVDDINCERSEDFAVKDEMLSEDYSGQNVAEDESLSNEQHMQANLDYRDQLKEPEEADHGLHCPELITNHVDSTECQQSGLCNGKDATSQDKEDKWLYVLGHDKLKKRIIKEGDGDMRPTHGQIAIVSCVGYLESGEEIDKHGSLSFVLGDCDFVNAFDLCVALMDKGEIAEIITDPRFAYGELGRDPDIPPNATIRYVVELIDFYDQPEFSSLPVTERIQLGDEKRSRGNYLYSRNEYSRAIDCYNKALKILDDELETHSESPETLQQLVDTRLKCFNNLAAAQMKIEAWEAASKSCDTVLKVQPENVKALFRKGKCLANLGDTVGAVTLLKKALKLEPETKIIHQELSRLEKRSQAESKSEKALYQKMLGTDKEPFIKKKKTKMSGSSQRWMWYVVGGVAAAFVSAGLAAYRYAHF